MPKGKDASSEVHRLSDMLVEEVSFVDRAANRRKFLLVKRDAAMGAGAQITAKPDGTYTAAGGGSAAPAPNTNPPVPAEASAPRAKAGISLTDDVRAAMTDALEGVVAMLTDALDLVKGAKKVDPDPEAEEPMEPQALLDLVGEAFGELEDAMFAAFGGDEEEPGAADPAVPADGAAPVMASAPPPPLAKRLELARAKRVIVKAEAVRVGRDLVAKYGVRMKKERLARFQSAIDTLVSICSEVMAANLGKGKKPAAKEEDKPAAKEEDKPSRGKSVAKADASPADITQHPAFVALQKQFKAAAEKLTALEKNVTTSNAAPVNGSAPHAADDVSWPLDMNDARFGDRADPNYFGR